MLGAALDYAKSGFPVFPLGADGKRPRIARGFRAASRDLEQVRDWWRRWPNANIGIPVLAPYFVMDLDSERAIERFAALGALPEAAPTAKTGKGLHVWLRAPKGIEVGNTTRLRESIDVRGEGGYVVVPPSRHVKTGRRYTWMVGLEELESSPIEAPRWLLDLILERKRSHSRRAQRVQKPSGGKQEASQRAWEELLGSSVREGSRNDCLARVAGFLFRQIREDAALGTVRVMVKSWADSHFFPRLPSSEVDRTIDSILVREKTRRRRAEEEARRLEIARLARKANSFRKVGGS